MTKTENDSDDEWHRVRVITRVFALPPIEGQGADDKADTSWFCKLAVMNDENTRMDDRQLLWCIIKAGIWRRPIGSVQDMLLQELADRLYPDYDSINVMWAEWGWLTPEGEIRYVED